MPEPTPKVQLAFSLLSLFPPLLRASVLEDAEFRTATGLNTQASIRLNQSGVTFDRATLYAAVRRALSGEGETPTIESVDKTKWFMSKNESGTLVVTAGNTTVPLPDFECLSPDPAVRLNSFERHAKEFSIDDFAAEKWRGVLAVRSCDDEEVEELKTEFRLTPRWFANALLQGVEGESDVPVSSLVPDDQRYFHRLAGSPAEKDLLSYIKSDLSRHIERQIAYGGVHGVALALLLSAHPFIPQEIRLNGLSNSEVIKLFEWLEVHGDRISQLGGIELGLAHLDVYPELEPIITRMTRAFVEEDTEKVGRLTQLAGLVVLVDGELARNSILRAHQPYWRRLAAIAHATLLERELLRLGGSVSDFSAWAYPNRGHARLPHRI